MPPFAIIVTVVVPPVTLLPLAILVPPVAIMVPPVSLLPLAVIVPPVACYAPLLHGTLKVDAGVGNLL